MFISKYHGSYFIHATDEDGLQYNYQQYLWYTKKNAIKEFRKKYGLEHQHFKLNIIAYEPMNYGYAFY